MLSVYLNLDKRFAFIELRTMSEAAAALQMDGVLFRGMSLRMRRPNDYNPIAFPPVDPPVRSFLHFWLLFSSEDCSLSMPQLTCVLLILQRPRLTLLCWASCRRKYQTDQTKSSSVVSRIT